jgi:hypothetical protein
MFREGEAASRKIDNKYTEIEPWFQALLKLMNFNRRLNGRFLYPSETGKGWGTFLWILE